jgi:hypothetical protein
MSAASKAGRLGIGLLHSALAVKAGGRLKGKLVIVFNQKDVHVILQ